MARLEIEITSKGIQNTTKDIKSLENSLGSMQKRYQDAQQIVGGLSRQQMQLQKSMNDLKASFAAGAMSAELYEKEMSSLSNEYSVAAGKIQAYQSQMSSLKATIDQLSNGTRSLGNAQKSLQAYSNDFTGGMRSSNAIAVEFSRVIQDMPYGMQGIGNNLQQLTQNFAYYAQSARAAAAAQGKTISSFGIIRGALGSLISPINLLTLGVSALTAGWVLYEKWQQRANKAVKEGEDSFGKYIETLKGLARVQADGAISAQKEIVSLEMLYKASQNLTIPMEERRLAASKLIELYPEQLKGLDQEAILAGKASEAYKDLANSMMKASIAAAAVETSTKNASKQLENRLKMIELTTKANQIQAEIDERNARGSSGYGAGGVASGTSDFDRKTNELDRERVKILKEVNQLGIENGEIEKQNAIIQQEYNSLLKDSIKLEGEKVKKVKAVKDETDKYVSALEKLRSMRLDLGVNISDNDKEEAKVKRTFRKLFEGANEALANALSVKPNDTKAIEEYWATVRQISLARSKEIEIARQKDKEKAMGDIAQIELNYEKRSTQSITQMITNKLNNQYKAEVKALNKLHKERLSSEKEVLEDQKRLQEKYWKDIADLDVLDNISRVGFLGLKDAIADADEQFQKFIDGLTDLSEIERLVKMWERFKEATKNEKKIMLFDGIKEVSNELSNIVNAFANLDSDLGGTIRAFGQLANQVNQIAKIVQTIGSGIKESSGGNPIVALIGAIVEIIGTIWQAVEQANKKRKAEQKAIKDEYDDFYAGVISGEREYSRLLRDRAKQEAAMSGSTRYESIKAQMAESLKLIPQIEKEYDDMLKRLQSQNFLVDIEIDSKANWITGNVKTTRRDILKALTGAEYDELERLYTEGRLEGQTKKDFEALRALKEELLATGKSVEELQKELDQLLTGTTIEQLASGIVDMFRQGKTSAKDFAEFTKEVIRNAMVSSFIAKYAMKYIEPFFDELSNQMDTGVYDYSKLEDLATKGIGQIGSGLEVIEKALGIKLFDPLAQAGRGIAGEIGRAITEESATRIEGIWRGIYDIDRRLLDVQMQALSYLGGITGGFNREEITVQINLMSEIAANTLRAAENTDVLPPMLEAMEEVVLGIGAIAKNTKQQSGRDLGV